MPLVFKIKAVMPLALKVTPFCRYMNFYRTAKHNNFIATPLVLQIKAVTPFVVEVNSFCSYINFYNAVK